MSSLEKEALTLSVVEFLRTPLPLANVGLEQVVVLCSPLKATQRAIFLEREQESLARHVHVCFRSLESFCQDVVAFHYNVLHVIALPIAHAEAPKTSSYCSNAVQLACKALA